MVILKKKDFKYKKDSILDFEVIWCGLYFIFSLSLFIGVLITIYFQESNRKTSVVSKLLVIDPGLEGSETLADPLTLKYRGMSSLSALNDKYDCAAFLRIAEVASNPAMTFWMGSHGDNFSCPIKFLNKFANQPHLLQIHFNNGPCRRDKCGKGTLFYKLSVDEYNSVLINPNAVQKKRLIEQLEEIKKFVDTHASPKTLVVLSLELEDNFTDRSYRAFIRLAKTVWKGKISRNPVGNIGVWDGATFFEVHGKAVRKDLGKKCIFNMDGQAMLTPSQERKGINHEGISVEKTEKLFKDNKECIAGFVWEPYGQGFDDKKGWLPIEQRKSFKIPNETEVYVKRVLKASNTL